MKINREDHGDYLCSFFVFFVIFAVDFPRRENRNCLAGWKISEVVHWTGALCNYSLHFVRPFSLGNSGSRS